MQRVLLPLAFVAPIAAQAAAVPEARVSPAVLASDAPVLHGRFGSAFTSAYFFRGMRKETKGTIGEPFLELDLRLAESPGLLRALDFRVGQWNSLHDGPTGSGGGTQSMWYEDDLYAGLAAQLDERWRTGVVYTAYYSPNSSFRTVQEVAVSAAFDDRDLLWTGWSGLRPAVQVAFETSGQADASGSSGVYGECAIEPTVSLGAVGDLDVRLALPVKLGLSLGGYYQSPTGGDATFGYLDVGAVVSAPLAFLPRRLGPWSGSLGVHALFLGSTTEQQNQGDGVEWIVTAGLSTTF